MVFIAGEKRRKASPWENKSVIYHEYGHCIDAQRKLWQDPELARMRGQQIKALLKKEKYTIRQREWDAENGKFIWVKKEKLMSRVAYIDRRLNELNDKVWNMNNDTFTRMGITKRDVIEQIGSTLDTIKSLVISYGSGHSDAYFRVPRMKETEYLAHAFENAFLGNEVFKKFLPDIYAEMVAYVRALKPY